MADTESRVSRLTIEEESFLEELRQKIPLHARLFWYELSAGELAVLQAYVDHSRDGDGQTLWASVERIACYSNLSVSQVQRIIGAGPHGDGKDKNGKPLGGFVSRRILIPRQRAAPKKSKAASYMLNEAALKVKPAIVKYLTEDRQRALPGIRLPPRHGQRIGGSDRPPAPAATSDFAPSTPGRTMRPGGQEQRVSARDSLVASCDQPGSTMRPGPGSTTRPALVAPCDQPGSTMRPDPSSFIEYVSSRDSSSPKDSLYTSTSTDSEFFEQLGKSLREVLPGLDHRAIKQIGIRCLENAPDCTVEEIVHFAWEKAPALRNKNTQSPSGLLIAILPQCFEGTLLRDYREERRKAQDLWKEKQLEAQIRSQQIVQDREEWLAGESERERQKNEARLLQEEREAAELRGRAEREQRECEEEQRAINALDQMSAAEREALREEAMQDPKLEGLLKALRKLSHQRFASESSGESQIREKMLELLKRRFS